jgi:hypothetical protein
MNAELQYSPTLDELEAVIASCPQAHLPVCHRFTPGMYIREIRIPAGTLLTSATHLTQHPFVLSKGTIQVISENEGPVIYEAPHTGITDPGTRRVLYAETDCVWTTFHATDETDVEKICTGILASHDNPIAPGLTPAWRDSLPILPNS